MIKSLAQPRAILFDWDNTLVDTWPVIHAALNATFRYMDHPEWSIDETRERVRLSLRDAFPAMFGDRWEDARDVFYASFEAVHLSELRELEGANSLLETLTGASIPVAVVSNKTGRYLRAEADHLGWSGHFHALIGAGDAAKDKPSPEPVSLAMAGMPLRPGPDVWFVGDSGVDMQIGWATGTIPVLVAPAGKIGPEFEDHPPVARFDNLSDLREFLTAP